MIVTELCRNVPIVLVRHALIPSHYDRMEFAKTPDKVMPIMAAGIRQSQAVGKALGKFFDEKKIRSASVWVSSYKRTQQTEAAAAPFLGIPYKRHMSGNLREQDYGIWDGVIFEEIDAQYPGQRAALEKNPIFGKRPGGESKDEVIQRCIRLLELKALPELRASKNEVLVIFTHSVTMRALKTILTGGPLELVLGDKPKNCEAWFIQNGEKTVLFPGFDVPPQQTLQSLLPKESRKDQRSGYAAPAIL